MSTDGHAGPAGSCPGPGQAPIRTWLQSSRRRAAVASKVVTDPTARFHGDGVRYKAKLIGMDEVVQARGDKMCLDSMMKLKGQEAASRSHGKHKQKVLLRVCSEGLKIVDEKTGCVMYEHDARRISSLKRDESDCRALAYVFQHLGSYTLFYIKMANMADPVLDDIQQVCQDLDQVSPEKPTQGPTQNKPLLFLDESDPIPAEVPADLVEPTSPTRPLREALPSNELEDIFTIRLDEPATANQIAASPQQGSPQKALSTAQILSNFPTLPSRGSPYSPPTTMGPWGLVGPFPTLSPPTSPQWGAGGAPAPWPGQTGAPAAWAQSGPVWPPMQAYGPPQHQPPPARDPWGQSGGMSASPAPAITAQLYPGPPIPGSPVAPAPQQQPSFL
ncbi:disabled homolog 1 [Gadus morhua]|uniref:disabled homolog 1 n=1 Tax=Gadus morhua TaxID=8049 RepID=UPI0011B70220|nr:disabled homolog 1-like [Gadus morhua]